MVKNKDKISGITNTKKILWIRIKHSKKNIRRLDGILKKFGKDYFSIFYRFEENQERTKNRLDFSFDFYSNIEAGYVIPDIRYINILLRKDSKLFRKLRKGVFDYFEIAR